MIDIYKRGLKQRKPSIVSGYVGMLWESSWESSYNQLYMSSWVCLQKKWVGYVYGGFKHVK